MCKVIEDFKISLIEDGKSTKTIKSYVGDRKAFIEFIGSKGVEFNGNLQRFYVVSYKNFLVESNYQVATIKIYGKGGKFREVPLKFDLSDTIKEYIRDRDYNLKDSEYLIIGQKGALRRDAINTMLERLTNDIGMINKLKPHTFRHTFCTRLINRGVPISTVSKLAGHSSIDTSIVPMFSDLIGVNKKL
ncbi:tyrosine-type recombinase/integrase [Clostridium sp.]|uniref:tyrosine-type recombinase/integrase n=1 Tax=Clostridium sp. TaxID=1506 RepID=UPI002623D9A7|nr:tyrosine-type recombinase/integrase [Clostridium sp.]